MVTHLWSVLRYDFSGRLLELHLNPIETDTPVGSEMITFEIVRRFQSDGNLELSALKDTSCTVASSSESGVPEWWPNFWARVRAHHPDPRPAWYSWYRKKSFNHRGCLAWSMIENTRAPPFLYILGKFSIRIGVAAKRFAILLTWPRAFPTPFIPARRDSGWCAGPLSLPPSMFRMTVMRMTNAPHSIKVPVRWPSR